jgi:ABC-type sugar transport system permease subunit
MADLRPIAVAPAVAAGATARRHRMRRGLGAWLFVVPAAAVYLAFAIWPTITTAGLSFFAWDGILPPIWNGIDNYLRIFSTPRLLGAIGHSLLLIVFFSLLPVCAGLFLTAMLTGRIRRGITVFRVIFFLPQVLPLVAVGITWRWLYSENGIINQGLSAIGLGGVTRAWLADYELALIALGLIGTWTMSGLCMMLFLSGAQKIDPALFEAAVLDGAGSFRQFTAVTLPGLRNEITIAAVITTIAALASFDLVFVTTNGGPANQTTVPGLLVYRLAFNEGTIGAASALAVVLSLIVIAAVTIIRAVAKDRS